MGSKSLPLLAPISFVPSHNLWLLIVTAYGLFSGSFCIALWPFLADFPALWLLLLLLVVCIAYSLKRAHRQRWAGVLSYSEQGWLLQASNGKQPKRLQLKGEVLIWPGLVILSFVDITTRRVLRLVIAEDSVSEADFACLRRWLRRSLLPKV